MIEIFKNIFSRKNKQYLHSFEDIAVDIHSHLIPNIDDGSKSYEESLIIIKKLKELGFKKIITTPHTMQGGYDNTKDIIVNGLNKLNVYLNNHDVFHIDASSEYFGDDYLLKLIEHKELLPINDTFILFEQSFVQKSATFDDIVFKILLSGYKPILAHPERYSYFMDKNLKQLKELKSKGVLFQLNLFSLLGVYGDSAKQTAERLIDAEMVDFVGTDIHNELQLKNLEPLWYNIYLKKLIDQNKLQNKTLF